MFELMVLLVMFLGFSGCIGFQSFPLAARSGDTISLALGGSVVHETIPGDQITLNDLDITIQQDINQNGVIDDNEKFAVTKRYLFRIYPDPTSYVWNFSAEYYGTNYGTPVGQGGEWSAIVDLTDPIGTPLPLVGNLPATLAVTTSKLTDNFWYSAEGSLSNIPINILPGTGQSHHFNNDGGSYDADFAHVQPLPQLAIGFTGSADIAAAALDIDYNETVLMYSTSAIKIIQDITQPNIILNQRIYSDNGNWKMRILLMTNTGNIAPGALKCFIVWRTSAITSGQIVTTGTFPVTSAKFYNESGAEVTGISVVQTLLYQP